MKHDPHERIELKGHTLYPEDMQWWSLTCYIAREWRLMMEAGRSQPSADAMAGKPCGTSDSKVVFLQDVLRRWQERRSAGGGGARLAAAKQVDQDRRGPRLPRRG